MLEEIRELLQKRHPSGKFVVILIVFILISLWFYWFQWRPAEIRKECTKLAIEFSEVADTVNMPLDPEKLNQFKSAMIKKGYSLKKIDEFIEFKTKMYGGNTMTKAESFQFNYDVCLHERGLK